MKTTEENNRKLVLEAEDHRHAVYQSVTTRLPKKFLE